MPTITVHITIPDDRYGELREMLNKFKATESDTISFSEAVKEFGIPKSTLTFWTHVKKYLPYSQPAKGGKKYVRRSDLRQLIEVKDLEKKTPKRRKNLLDILGGKR